jgi:hypothetical protein
MLIHLRSDIEGSDAARFKLVFLLDDFSGSGLTLLRGSATALAGRIPTFAELLRRDAGQGNRVFDGENTFVYVCLCIATRQSLEHLKQAIAAVTDAPWAGIDVLTAQVLGENCRVSETSDPEFATLLRDSYDPAIEGQHTGVGGKPLHYGFAGCGLPLVLEHNTPNNSVYLLWSSSDKVAPLFPRIERHHQ